MKKQLIYLDFNFLADCTTKSLRIYEAFIERIKNLSLK